MSKPNSWAVVALWRRAFELKKEEEEEQIETVADIVRNLVDAKKIRPVADPEVVEARKDYLKDHYRNMIQQKKEQDRHVHVARERQEQQLNRPNLDIPVLGDRYHVTLAQ